MENGDKQVLAMLDDVDVRKKVIVSKNAQARNRTGGSTMATLNFTTKPLAPAMFSCGIVTKRYDLYFGSCGHIGV